MNNQRGKNSLKRGFGILAGAALAFALIPGGSAAAASPYTGDSIRNLHSGLCLEIADWSQNNGAIARQWSCTGNPNQSWNFGNYANPSSGYESSLPWVAANVNSNKCLEIGGWGTNWGDGADQWSCTGQPNQAWGWGSAGFW